MYYTCTVLIYILCIHVCLHMSFLQSLWWSPKSITWLFHNLFHFMFTSLDTTTVDRYCFVKISTNKNDLCAKVKGKRCEKEPLPLSLLWGNGKNNNGPKIWHMCTTHASCICWQCVFSAINSGPLLLYQNIIKGKCHKSIGIL